MFPTDLSASKRELWEEIGIKLPYSCQRCHEVTKLPYTEAATGGVL